MEETLMVPDGDSSSELHHPYNSSPAKMEPLEIGEDTENPNNRQESLDWEHQSLLATSDESRKERLSGDQKDNLGDDRDEEDDSTCDDGIYRDKGTRRSRNAISRPEAQLVYALNYSLFPDSAARIYGVELLDEYGVKLLKFFMATALSLVLIHVVAQIMNSERDEQYSLKEMVLYDGNHIALDIIVYFAIGRLYEQQGVDHLAWIMPAIGSASVFLLGATNFPALRHTLSAYDMHCLWPWQMWVLIFGVAIPLVLGIVGSHIVYAYRQRSLLRKTLELIIVLGIWFVPYMSHPFFHLHHWYYAWLIGMHTNFNVWWSRLTMSVFWGIYIHGIAVWGRDPILTCAISLYQSQNGECPFLVDENYTLQALSTVSGTGWQNCSESIDYVP